MTRRIPLLIPLTAVLVLTACQQKSQNLRLYMDNEIARLKDADPKADVTAAVAANDLRFLAIAGKGPLLPGIGDNQMDLVVKRFGFRYIENATIDPADEQEKELSTVAWGYAENYNILLAKKVRMER